MKLGDVLGPQPDGEPDLESLEHPSRTPDPNEPSVVDQVRLMDLAEKVIQAVDIQREVNARVSIAKQDLESAMDALNVQKVQALGRTLAFSSTTRPELTLKAIKTLLTEDEAKKLWNNLPRKTYRTLEVPKASDGEPEVE